MNEEISYKFKDNIVKEKFEKLSSDELISFLTFLAKRYQGKEIFVKEISSIEFDNIPFAFELMIKINDKDLTLSSSYISGFYNLEDGDKMMRFISNGEPVSIVYKFQNTEITLGINPMKMVFLVLGVKGLFEVEFICDKEYDFKEDREKIINYFRENTFDNLRVTTLLNIITKLVDTSMCNIKIKHEDDFVLYKHGALVKYKEIIVEGKRTKILSTYFDTETNKYVEEKIIKTKKHTKKYNFI